jgi:hypothetical protein
VINLDTGVESALPSEAFRVEDLSTPEPSTFGLICVAAFGLGLLRRCKLLVPK